MSMTVNLFLIAIAFVVAVQRIAFSSIKKKDRQKGLYLNDSSYTLLGTAKLLFLKQEKRLERETEESFEDFLDKHPGENKALKITAVLYCAVLLLTSVIQLAGAKGLTDLILMNLSLIAIGVSFLITKGSALIVISFLYGIISAVYGVSLGVFSQLFPLVGGLVITGKFVAVRRAYKKLRRE